MTTWPIAALATVAALLLALPAAAQIGTPGTGPLYPGGPRQGLGPPSITDSVPDIRLHAPGGGIPGAGPPIDYGGRNSVPSYGRPQPLAQPGLAPRREVGLGRRCRTQRNVCALPRSVTVGTACSCRTARSARVRGHVVR